MKARRLGREKVGRIEGCIEIGMGIRHRPIKRDYGTVSMRKAETKKGLSDEL